MYFFWLDASALIKRYAIETGSPLMNHLFSRVSARRLLVVLHGAGEVIFALVRQRNAGILATNLFHQAITNLAEEIVGNYLITKLHPSRLQVRQSWVFITRYSLNSTDAIILRCALDTAAKLRTAGNDLILVSADMRLVRSAQAEGLRTFNPETDSRATLDELIESPPASSAE